MHLKLKTLKEFQFDVTRSSPVVTKWVTITSVLTGQSPVETVPACPVQIGAHHHIDVTDINESIASTHFRFGSNYRSPWLTEYQSLWYVLRISLELSDSECCFDL